MGSKIIDKDKGYNNFYREIRYLKNSYTKVGIQSTEESKLIMIGAVNEFGANVKVTDKMRKYLHAIGLHLKKTTNFIKIPERSYIRAGIDSNRTKIELRIKKELDNVIKGKFTSRQALGRIGEFAQMLIQRQIRNTTTPANHPFTIEQKGSSHPLVNTGRLRKAITHVEIIKTFFFSRGK